MFILISQSALTVACLQKTKFVKSNQLYYKTSNKNLQICSKTVIPLTNNCPSAKIAIPAVVDSLTPNYIFFSKTRQDWKFKISSQRICTASVLKLHNFIFTVLQTMTYSCSIISIYTLLYRSEHHKNFRERFQNGFH